MTVLFTVLQRRLMYRPTVADSLTISDAGLDPGFGVDTSLVTADGQNIKGWLVNATGRSAGHVGRAPLVLYFPGNSLNRYERVHDLQEVASHGFDVLVFDYRGFGDSTGTPTESALTADARLVWQYATDTLKYEPQRIVVFGESLGGAVALSMWSRTNPHPPQPAAMILSSTFASMSKTVAWHYPLFPFQFLLADRWPSIERIGRVQAPVVVFHGTQDDMVPVAHARALAQASAQARFIEVSGAGHNDIPTNQLRLELDSLMAAMHAR
ncbi:MAG: alpha/beta hydrolase [Fuerstiella sp.]